MKTFLRVAFIFLTVLKASDSLSQNVMINVLTQNAGVVKKGSRTFFEVTIYNTSPSKSLGIFKIRPQISFPASLVNVSEKGHVLPEGWSISIQKNAVATLTNGTDVIPENSSRTILIAIVGKAAGGPSPIVGNLFFSNGTAPGFASGIAPKEDNTADNFSSSSIKVL